MRIEKPFLCKGRIGRESFREALVGMMAMALIGALALTTAFKTSAVGQYPGKQKAIEIIESRIEADKKRIKKLNLGITAEQPMIPVVGQQQPVCTSPPAGLVGWWPGDGNYKDIISGNNGTPVGGVTFSSGEVGQAFSLNGADASVKVPDLAGKLSLGSGEMTLDAWISAPPFIGGSDVRTIVAKNNPSFPFQGYFLRIRGDNRVEFAATDCETVACGFSGEPGSGAPKEPVRSTSVVADGRFHHVAGIRRADGTREIWVDGHLENRRSEAMWNTDSDNPLYIGEIDGTGIYRFVGLADEVEVFNRALSADEIGKIVAAGSAGKCKCQVNVTPWKQNHPWGSNDYDQSYTAHPSSPISTSGHMELKVGTSSYVIPLSDTANNLGGLANGINALDATLHIGVNAVIDTRTGQLSLYNTGCILVGDCFPRSSHKLHLCDGPCRTEADDILTAKKMSQVGCAVTALAMAFDALNVGSINTTAGPKQFSPLELNEFMSNTEPLLMPGGRFDRQGNVDWMNTPYYIGVNLSNNKFQFDGSIQMDEALCTDHLPVIVQVTSPHGRHYVIVTGKQGPATDGSQYSIQDPGYSKTTLKDYNNTYTVVGVVRDPVDMSQFNLSVGDNAELLIADPNGRQTGFDALAGQLIRQIPSSAYLRTQVDDDESGGTSTGLTHSIQIRMPVEGPYRVVVSGVQTGMYRITMHAYSQDGSAQPLVELEGITTPGLESVFQIQSHSIPGSVTQAVRVASFQGTLDDISNSLAFGLIDGAGIAKALASKIRAAASAVAEGKNDDAKEILNAFKRQVRAQTGKDITGIAPQILQEDADSLINQNTR